MRYRLAPPSPFVGPIRVASLVFPRPSFFPEPRPRTRHDTTNRTANQKSARCASPLTSRGVAREGVAPNCGGAFCPSAACTHAHTHRARATRNDSRPSIRRVVDVVASSRHAVSLTTSAGKWKHTFTVMIPSHTRLDAPPRCRCSTPMHGHTLHGHARGGNAAPRGALGRPALESPLPPDTQEVRRQRRRGARPRLETRSRQAGEPAGKAARAPWAIQITHAGVHGERLRLQEARSAHGDVFLQKCRRRHYGAPRTHSSRKFKKKFK